MIWTSETWRRWFAVSLNVCVCINLTFFRIYFFVILSLYTLLNIWIKINVFWCKTSSFILICILVSHSRKTAWTQRNKVQTAIFWEQVFLLIVDFSLTYFTYCLDTFTVFFVTGRPLSCFLFQNEPKPSSVRRLVWCGAVHSGYCSFYTFWATGHTAACFQCFLCSVFVSQLQSRSTLMQEQWNTSLKVIPRQLAQNPELLSWIFLNKINV